MTLAEQKQLEDIKTRATGVYAQLAARNETAVRAVAKEAEQAFRTHFEKADFQVSGSCPGQVTAKYQTLEYALTFNLQGGGGAWATLGVQQVGPQKTPRAVRVVKKGYNGPTVVIRTGQPNPLADAQFQLDEAEASLAGPKLEFSFLVDDEKSTKQRPLFKTYGNFAHVLSDLYK